MSVSLHESAPIAPTPPPGGRAARLGIALVIIAAAQLMIVLDATIVNIALPKVETALGFSKTGLQWVVTAYALSLGSLLLLGGRLGDLWGQRRMFTVGVTKGELLRQDVVVQLNILFLHEPQHRL